jgi:muconolactone delta-isomerase
MSQETSPEAIAPKRPFPVLPTSKILALGRFTAPPTPEQVKAIFPQEVPDTLQLYLDGKIEQMWARQDQKGPVFLMNVTSVAEAHAILQKLPLGQAKLMEFELVELTPLTPLHMLLTEGWANGTK